MFSPVEHGKISREFLIEFEQNIDLHLVSCKIPQRTQTVRFTLWQMQDDKKQFFRNIIESG